MTKRTLKISVSTVTFLLVVCIMLYLFRKEKFDNPALGIMYYKYRWGIPDMLLGDTNRDGKIDAKASYRGLGTFIGPPRVYWEDRNFNGVFESKMLTEGDTSIVWIDINEDGLYDKELHGEEASRYYMTLSQKDR